MAEAEGRAQRPRIQSALRVVEILRTIAKTPSGLTAQEAADLLGLPLQTVYRLLRPLNRSQLIGRNTNFRYVLGPAARALTKGLPRRDEHLDFATDLQALSGRTRESAHVAGWCDGQIVVEAAVQGWPPNDLVDTPVGRLTSAHSRAAGKLLLAFAVPSDRDEYLRRSALEPVAPRTITSRGMLDEELRLIREQQYAVELEEFAGGVCGLAVLMRLGSEDYALGLSAPADRFHARFPGLLEQARRCAAEVEGRIYT